MGKTQKSTVKVADLDFRKSSWSKNNPKTCVEVATIPSVGVVVRDSKGPGDVMLRFTFGEWEAFVNGVKAGEFDTAGGV